MDELSIGKDLPELKKQVTQERINLYAHASGDFNPVHIDEEFARQKQLGGTIAHGMLILAHISEFMTNSFGQAWLTDGRLNARFKAPARPGDTMTIKLTPPGGFWQIDWIAVDYAQEAALITTELAPIQAIDSRGDDVRSLLTATDAVYQAMPDTQQWIKLRFTAPPRRPGLERTVILKACGYYTLHLEATQGPPRWDIIDRLHNEPGFTTRFAREQIRKWKQAHEHSEH